MPIFAGLDTETTGLTWGDHRFVEVYVGLWNDAGVQKFAYETRIDPQRQIAADAQRVHGISIQDLVGKPTFETVAPVLAKVLGKADYYVAHNGVGFDIPFLQYEFERVGVEMPVRPVIDTMLEGIWSTPNGKKPNLGELCFACDENYETALAHAAAYDVGMMMGCFFKAKTWGFIKLPE